MEIVPEMVIQGSVMNPEFDSEGAPVIDKGRPKLKEAQYKLRQPYRLKFTLEKIDQEFFRPIKELIGEEYFTNFPFKQFLKPVEPGNFESLEPHLRTILPVVEHNPIIVFDLRAGVRFHDGHEFDSGDVLFTYQAIMNTSNASPRRSDYEPVKSAEILGPLKRIRRPVSHWVIQGNYHGQSDW